MRVEKWAMVEDAGRGWRRVVPSPKPLRIIEGEVIRHLVKDGCVVIGAGGGGIPVVADENGKLSGAAAVIDKDLASAVLAHQIRADLFVISTAVEKVYLDYGKPNQQGLDTITVSQAQRYSSEGHFQAGSMLPKIQACIEFVQNGGSAAIITSPSKICGALEGKTGTRIVP